VDSLDASAFPLRPIDAPGLEIADPAGYFEYAADGAGVLLWGE